MRRILGDSLLRYLFKNLTIPQLPNHFGTTVDVYTKWMRQVQLPIIVDELGEAARLLWIGPKRLQHVVLFVHGGGYALPPPDFALSFWQHVRLELEKQNVEAGFAILNYSLWPTATFPTPLDQTRRAVEFLIEAGVQPSHLHIAGDSAGANLIIQLLSHMLHPRPDVDEIRLREPIRAIYLISPWVSLSGDSQSHDDNDGIDYMPKSGLIDIGGHILAGFSTNARVFAEAIKAPPAWFEGLEAIVASILITVGGAECLRDDILAFGEILKEHHPAVEVAVQPGGFHEDMFLDFFVGETKLGSLTPLLVDRLVTGCT